MAIAIVAMVVFPLVAVSAQVSDEDAPAISSLVKAFLTQNAPETLAEPGPVGKPLSPFGGSSLLAPEIMGHANLWAPFELVINPTGAPVFTDPDFDGTPDFTGNLIRAAVNGQVTTEPLGMPYQGVVDQGLLPAAGSVPVFTIGDMIREMGLDPGATGPQDLDGQQVVVVSAPSTTETPLETVPVFVFGATIEGGLPVDGCGGNIIELGRADARRDGPLWEPADFAPNDIFAGTSHALVTRCQGADGWTMLAFDNTGSSFAPAGTGMVTIIHPHGFISFVPGHELAGTSGGRIFSFITPEVDGYQPDNTGFTSYPTFPDLTTTQPPIVVMDPFHGTNPLGVYPLQLDFSGASTDSTNCGAQSWSGLFDLYAWQGTDGNLDGALYQFASGQRSFGSMTVDGSLLTLDATGGGDQYSESFHLAGPTGTYLYQPNGIDCPFDVTIASGYDEALTAITGLTTVVEPPPPEDNSTTDTPGSVDSSNDQGDVVVATPDKGPNGGSGFGLPLIIVGGTLIVGGTYMSMRRRPVTVNAGGAATVSAPTPGEKQFPDVGDLWMTAFNSMGGGSSPPGTVAGTEDRLSDAGWRDAIHLEENAQTRIESAVRKAFEGDQTHPGIYGAFRRYLRAVDGFQTTFTRLLSSTTEFQGLLRQWAEAQDIARKQDLAFALIQLAWGGYSLSKWINAPTHIPWHRSTITGRMLASGSEAERTAVVAGAAGSGGTKVADAVTDAGRGADAATDAGRGADAAADAERGLDLFPRSPESAARTARQKTNIPKVRGMPNVHTAYVHGSQAGQFVTDSGRVISLERVAGIIEANPAYQVGKGVRLVSCWSGSSGLASRLARRLGTWVMAPTHPVGLNGNGQLLFRAEELAQGAHWVVFDPSGVARYRVYQNGLRVAITR